MLVQHRPVPHADPAHVAGAPELFLLKRGHDCGYSVDVRSRRGEVRLDRIETMQFVWGTESFECLSGVRYARG